MVISQIGGRNELRPYGDAAEFFNCRGVIYRALSFDVYVCVCVCCISHQHYAIQEGEACLAPTKD